MARINADSSLLIQLPTYVQFILQTKWIEINKRFAHQHLCAHKVHVMSWLHTKIFFLLILLIPNTTNKKTNQGFSCFFETEKKKSQQLWVKFFLTAPRVLLLLAPTAPSQLHAQYACTQTFYIYMYTHNHSWLRFWKGECGKSFAMPKKMWQW